MPPETTEAVHSSTAPTRTGARKLVFISTLEENTFLPAARAKVTVADPMAESAMAPRKPPWMMPAGLAKRSSARIRHTVRPGYGLVDTGHPEGQLAVGRDLDPLIRHRVTLPPAHSSILEA